MVAPVGVVKVKKKKLLDAEGAKVSQKTQKKRNKKI
jgi:hypothetical protein